jgi:hypothetical protein
MTRLQEAREHLREAQDRLSAARKVGGESHARYYEQQVKAALSWVWEEQLEQQVKVARSPWVWGDNEVVDVNKILRKRH